MITARGAGKETAKFLKRGFRFSTAPERVAYKVAKKVIGTGLNDMSDFGTGMVQGFRGNGATPPAPGGAASSTSPPLYFTPAAPGGGPGDYSHGNFGLAKNGQGSLSFVDMSQLPDKQPDQVYSPAPINVNLPPAVQQPQVENPPFGGSIGDLFVQGLRSRRDRTYANIRNQDAQTGILNRAQGINAAKLVADVGLRGRKNEIEAERTGALNKSASAQGSLFEAQAAKTARVNELAAALASPDISEADRSAALAELNALRPTKSAPIHYGEAIGKQGLEPYASTYDTQRGFRVFKAGAGGAPKSAGTSLQSALKTATPEERIAMKKLLKNPNKTTDKELAAALAAVRKGK